MSPAFSFQIRGERFTGGSSRLVARSVFAQCGPGAPCFSRKSLFRQVEDLRASEDADYCSAFRAPCHLSILSRASVRQHEGKRRCAQMEEVRAG